MAGLIRRWYFDILPYMKVNLFDKQKYPLDDVLLNPISRDEKDILDQRFSICFP